MSRQEPRPRRVVIVPPLKFGDDQAPAWPDEASDEDPSYYPDDDESTDVSTSDDDDMIVLDDDFDDFESDVSTD